MQDEVDGSALATTLRSYLDSSAAVQGLKEYCEPGRYTGFHFQSYGAAFSEPNRITSDDLFATTMLSIPVSHWTKSGLRPNHILALDQQRTQLSAYLSDLPDGVDLHELSPTDVDAVLGEKADGAAWQLFRYLRDEIGIPRVAAYKLVSRKRPRLLPVRDTVVEGALGRPARQPVWWTAWWAALRTDTRLVPLLSDLRSEVDVPASALSLLRVADICVWMAVRGGAKEWLASRG